MLFSRNAASYCSRPRLRSQPPMSMKVTKLKLLDIIVPFRERVQEELGESLRKAKGLQRFRLHETHPKTESEA